MPEKTQRKMLAPFRHRDLRYLAGGLAVSQTGDWLYNVALLVFVLRATGSPAWVAAAGIVRLLPYVVFGPIGGVIADRYPRKRVMIYSDLIRAAVMVGMMLVASSTPSKLSAFLLILLAGAATTFAVAYAPSVSAAVPVLVAEDELSAVNAIFSTIQNVCVFIGPALGGLILLWGTNKAFGVNAVTFCLSAFAVSRIKADLGPLKATGLPEAEAEKGPTFIEHLREGIAAITTSKDALVLVGAWTSDSFLYGMQIVFFTVIATELLHAGPSGISLLYAGSGIGGIAAAVIANRAANRPRQGVIVGLATAVAGITMAAFTFTTVPIEGYALAAVDGAATIVLDVMIITSLQRMLGNDLMGRAFGAIDSMVVAGMVAGSLAAPVLIQIGGGGAKGVKVAVVIGGALVFAVGLLVLRRARGIDRAAAERATQLAPRVDLLVGLNIFGGASRATLEALAAQLTEEHVEAGTVVIREGDEPDDLFVGLSGHLVVTAEGRGVVGELDAGDYFGEIGLLKRIPRTATVTAATPCDLYRINGEEFLRLVNEGAQSTNLFKNLQARMAVTRPAQREETAG